jgi:hypothetical protein
MVLVVSNEVKHFLKTDENFLITVRNSEQATYRAAGILLRNRDRVVYFLF